MPTKTVVTGTIQNVAGNLATSGTVEFQLQPNANSLAYRVSGTAIIAPNSVRATINASGLLKAENGTDPLELWGNDTLSPANTFYRAKFFPEGVPTQTWNLLLIQGATYDLSAPQFFEPAEFVPNESPPRFQQIESNIIPAYDGQYVLGTDQKKFAAAYIQQLFIETINITQLVLTGDLDVGGNADVVGDIGVGGNGVLDNCTSTNTWTNAVYVPYDYPYPGTSASCTPAKLLFISQPANAVLGASIGPVSVGIYSAADVLCNTETSTITLVISSGSCSMLTGTTVGAASSGVFTTTDLAITAGVGSCALQASATGLTSSDSNTFTISSAGTFGGAARGRTHR